MKRTMGLHPPSSLKPFPLSWFNIPNHISGIWSTLAVSVGIICHVQTTCTNLPIPQDSSTSDDRIGRLFRTEPRPPPFPRCVLKRAHLPLISTGPKYLIVPSIWSSQSRLCVTQCSWDLFMSLFFGWGGPRFYSPAYYRPRSNFQAILDHTRVV